jgi:uncharacterized protein with GYD domain
MPRYLIQCSYTAAASAAFVAKPQGRTAGVKALLEKLGGTLHSFDYGYGEDNVIIICEMPDDVAGVAAALVVKAAGHVEGYRATRLMSEADFLAAQQKAHGVSYAPPAKG